MCARFFLSRSSSQPRQKAVSDRHFTGSWPSPPLVHCLIVLYFSATLSAEVRRKVRRPIFMTVVASSQKSARISICLIFRLNRNEQPNEAGKGYAVLPEHWYENGSHRHTFTTRPLGHPSNSLHKSTAAFFTNRTSMLFALA